MYYPVLDAGSDLHPQTWSGDCTPKLTITKRINIIPCLNYGQPFSYVSASLPQVNIVNIKC